MLFVIRTNLRIRIYLRRLSNLLNNLELSTVTTLTISSPNRNHYTYLLELGSQTQMVIKEKKIGVQVLLMASANEA